MLEQLKQRVCKANLDLVTQGLVVQTFGNASGIDRDSGQMVIKASGVPYENMTAEDMVVVSLDTGEVIGSDLRPSSDTPTHLALYRAFTTIGGVIHTHSIKASAWAQARKEIPPLGTTHADFFHGPVPIARELTKDEIADAYEANTGLVIIERFAELDPGEMPAVLVAGHGPFAWGPTVEKAVENAVALEIVAQLAIETLRISPDPQPLSQAQLDKHFLRKHGPGAYYGQENK
jgi:L-ribulose-5-phosphate 4-epimerase